MPIEFACEECRSVLRVPDGTSGKRSRCPTCKHEQEIPWVVSGGHDAVASDKLSIPCPKCQHHLVCSKELLGRRGQCKKCQHIFTISTAPVSSELAAPALVFHCPKCRQLFEGREEMRGRKGKCHVCQSVFKIELEPAEPKPAKSQSPVPAASSIKTTSVAPKTQPSHPPVSEEDELIIIEDPDTKPSRRQPTPTPAPTPAPAPNRAPAPKVASPKPAAPAAAIRFECTQCNGVMEVPGSTAGLDTQCPYCQTVQTIPDASTVAAPAPAAGFAAGPAYSTNAYAQQPVDNYASNNYAANDPLGGFDLGLSNPYAAPTQTWTAPAPTTSYGGGSSGKVTVGNVLQLGFDSLFPSCLMYFLHMLIVMLVSGMMYGLFLGLVFAMRGTGETGLYVVGFAGILLLVGIGLMSAWFAGAISRMALNAVRKKPFDFADAFNPEGAFSSSILVVGGGMLIVLLMYLPAIFQMVTGVLKGFEGLTIVWILLFIPVMMLYGFGTCLALFAGADGDSSVESLQTSMSLVFRNFGTALAVLLISGLISGALAFFTFGVSYVVPIYMSAALYHLAKRNS